MESRRQLNKLCMSCAIYSTLVSDGIRGAQVSLSNQQNRKVMKSTSVFYHVVLLRLVNKVSFLSLAALRMLLYS